MLRAVYKNKPSICPLCNNIKFSLVKDEKVVNPPHKPTIKNILHSTERRVLFVATPVKNPIIKLPNTLTNSVPRGTAKNSMLTFSFETRYREILPINPPRPMSNNLCIIS